MRVLHLDIETYSSVDLKTSGVYKYAASEDFEILMVAYAIGSNPIQCYAWQDVPEEFFQMLVNPDVLKVAHNATFERICFRGVGYDVPVQQWRCSAIKASYCGLPMSLGDLTKALELGDKGKLSTGSALIRYFCMPVKATKVNGGRTRNLPTGNPVKWEQFKEYCINDVEAEREILHLLKKYTVPTSEWEAYFLDQQINDRGVGLDLELADKAIEADTYNSDRLNARLKELTGLDNPNSLAQLRKWIHSRIGKEVQSLAKEAIEILLKEVTDELVREVLYLRQQTGKTSIKKYAAMQSCAGADDRARGLFQFYGAGRTGRWAGRLIQLQNLPRNYMQDLDQAREDLKTFDAETFGMIYDTSDTLSQLIRTALVPTKGKIFAVADYSAIEARVIAWLAGEAWRLEVFATHGLIYEASASRMFNVDLSSIVVLGLDGMPLKDKNGKNIKGPNYAMRDKGKVAELALGYQGSVGALKTMGGEKMGLSEMDMEQIVDRWRTANPAICNLWQGYNTMALTAVKNRFTTVRHKSGVSFFCDELSLQITLPSGRKLFYWGAQMAKSRFGQDSIRYKGVNQINKQWGWIDTYGGKITENVVQAISRDLLLHSLMVLTASGYSVAMHVHDEAVCEIEREEVLDEVLELMSHKPQWAEGLPLTADGYVCDFYKKD